jgi:hypothetical protein
MAGAKYPKRLGGTHRYKAKSDKAISSTFNLGAPIDDVHPYRVMTSTSTDR